MTLSAPNCDVVFMSRSMPSSFGNKFVIEPILIGFMRALPPLSVSFRSFEAFWVMPRTGNEAVVCCSLWRWSSRVLELRTRTSWLALKFLKVRHTLWAEEGQTKRWEYICHRIWPASCPCQHVVPPHPGFPPHILWLLQVCHFPLGC